VPGYLKVDGSQRPVVAPYVKVNGNWQPVALGYTKVDGVWKIWHSAEIVDNFNRANDANLGTASNTFSQWNELSGNWAIQNNQAFYDGSAGPGIAFTQLYKASTDYKVTIDTPSNTGLGVSFWVQDNNNWHAAIPGSRQQDNPSFYSCPSGFTLNGTTCNRTTNYPASYEGPYTTSANPTYSYTYSCPNGGTLSGSSCVTSSSYPATSSTSTSYSCPSGSSGPSSTNRCRRSRPCTTSTSTTYSSSSSCPGGSSRPVFSGSGPNSVVYECTRTTTYCPPDDIFFATQTTSTSYSCPQGGTRSGSTCTTTSSYPATQTGQTQTGYSCPSGSTQNGSTCSYPGRGYYCPQGGTRNGTTCTLSESQSATFNPASTSYPSVIRIFRNLSGTITQVFTQDVSSDPRSMEVSTSGANITVALYSAAGLGGSRIASVVHNSGSSIRTRGVGIAKNGNQVQRQGSTVDNFRAE
jgi:hypothetical protein